MSDVFRIDVSPSRLSNAERAKILADPGFGRFFSDHMSIIYWNANKGWHGACITELRPFTLHPGCVALHYAQGVFEGLKAYVGLTGAFGCLDRCSMLVASANQLLGWHFRS